MPVGRVGLGPPVGVFPLFKLEFSKKNSRGNHDVNPPQMGDLMLVGLESGLPAMSQEGLWLQESTTNHHSSLYSTPPSPIE